MAKKWCETPHLRGYRDDPDDVVYCTRPAGHPGDHIASIGPYEPGKVELARWHNDRDEMVGHFLIWSIEHSAWWRADASGYTTRLSEAGVYNDADSAQIVARANIRKFHECRIPLESVLPDVPSMGVPL